MLINTALQAKQSWLHLIFYIWMEKKTPKKWHILHFIMKSLWMRIFINEIRKKSFSAVDMIKGGGGYYWGSPVTQVWCYSEFPLTAWEWKWALAGLPGSRHAPRGRSRALQSTATHQDRGALRLAMSQWQPRFVRCACLNEPCLMALAGPKCNEPSCQECKDRV